MRFVKSEKKGEKLFLEVRKRSQKSQKMVFIRELWKVPKVLTSYYFRGLGNLMDF